MENYIGQIYEGIISGVTNFGLFIKLPNLIEGLVHISKIAKEHIKNVADYVNVGDKVPVKVIEIDDQGRINLTMKDLVENNSDEKLPIASLTKIMTMLILAEKVEKLESVFVNILYLKPEDRVVAPNMTNLADLRTIINSIFDENKCLDVLYTLNTDKQFFGIRINPAMSASDATVILSTDEKVRLVNYQIEFDSKLFDIGLTGEELVYDNIYLKS